MIDSGALSALVETYKKHGWVLRRILVSAASKQRAKAGIASVLKDADIIESDVDAAWFSRPPKDGGVAWELRYLGDIPYALVEKIDENAPDFEQELKAIQLKLIDAIGKKRKA